MVRAAVSCLIVFVFLVPATAVYAQGAFGFPTVGFIPAVTPVENRTGGWGDSWLGDLNVVLHAPRVHVWWSPSYSHIKLSGSGDAREDFDVAYGTAKLLWSTNGVWTGIGLPISITERLGFTLEGLYFFPGNFHVEGDVIGYENDPNEKLASKGNLNADTDWFSAELRGAYGIAGGLVLIGGIRYDYLQGTITVPPDLSQVRIFNTVLLANFPPHLDISLNSLFPYVGLTYNLGGPDNRLTVSAKGFPAAISVAEDAPDRAYWGELLCEWSSNPFRMEGFSLTLLAKVTAAHAIFFDLAEIANIFHYGDPSFLVAPPLTVNQALSVDWQQIFLGATVSLNFDLASPW